MKKILTLLIGLILITTPALAQAVINVNYSDVTRVIPSNFLGTNIMGFQPSSSQYQFSNYGEGLYDPAIHQTVANAENQLIAGGMKMLRWPGGAGTENYYWLNGIGPTSGRPTYLFGLDEFMKVCNDIGAQAVITINNNDTVANAAAMVDYLDGPNTSGHTYAQMRAANGHPAPYGVIYFEIGNEVEGAGYVSAFPTFYSAMKAQAATDGVTIKVGVVDQGPFTGDLTLFTTLGTNVDFDIVHIYPYGGGGNAAAQTYGGMTAEQYYYTVFTAIWDGPFSMNAGLNKINSLSTSAYGSPIPILLSEFNGQFSTDPSPQVYWRYLLGSAIINADLIKMFLNDSSIIAAQGWQYLNDFWGFASNAGLGGDPITSPELYQPYTSRPIALLYQLLASHMQSNLIQSSVTGYTSPLGSNILGSTWTNSPAFNCSTISDSGGVHTITFSGCTASSNPSQGYNYFNSYLNASSGIVPYTYYLATAQIQVTNFSSFQGVSLSYVDDRGYTYGDVALGYTQGTSGWITLEQIIPATAGASAIAAQVRSVDTTVGPLNGTVAVQNVQLIPFTDAAFSQPFLTPALSVFSTANTTNGKIDVFVINRDFRNAEVATVNITGENILNVVNSYTLNEGQLTSGNDTIPTNVAITPSQSLAMGNSLTYTFQAHSITCLEFTPSSNQLNVQGVTIN